MNLDQFDYALPAALIAQIPLPQRTASRLLHFKAHGAHFHDLEFMQVQNLLQKGDLLVLNNTKVIPARVVGKKLSGGKVELLVERRLDERTVLAQLKASTLPKPGSSLLFGHDTVAAVSRRQGGFFVLQFNHAHDFENLLQQFGQVPLPSYIRRPPTQADHERYQTVYAQHQGAVAAPTAGLHFDAPLLERLQQRGVEVAALTLHVGAGTFQPVREDNIKKHVMHAEQVTVTQQVCDQAIACKKRGRRVVAVGTTVVRALESAALSHTMQPLHGDTSLFICPGFQFNVVDALITNFHLPKSTLLMLVCAFSGYQTAMQAYHHAVTQRYRFYSYGDAMFIDRKN